MVKGEDYGWENEGGLRMGKRGGLWVKKRRESYGLEKGGKKGEGYECEKWGWLLVGL